MPKRDLTIEEKLAICEEDRKRLYGFTMQLGHARLQARFMQRLAAVRRIVPDEKYREHFKDMTDVFDTLLHEMFILERDNYDLKQKLQEKENE